MTSVVTGAHAARTAVAVSCALLVALVTIVPAVSAISLQLGEPTTRASPACGQPCAVLARNLALQGSGSYSMFFPTDIPADLGGTLTGFTVDLSQPDPSTQSLLDSEFGSASVGIALLKYPYPSNNVFEQEIVASSPVYNVEAALGTKMHIAIPPITIPENALVRVAVFTPTWVPLLSAGTYGEDWSSAKANGQCAESGGVPLAVGSILTLECDHSGVLSHALTDVHLAFTATFVPSGPVRAVPPFGLRITSGSVRYHGRHVFVIKSITFTNLKMNGERGGLECREFCKRLTGLGRIHSVRRGSSETIVNANVRVIAYPFPGPPEGNLELVVTDKAPHVLGRFRLLHWEPHGASEVASGCIAERKRGDTQDGDVGC